MVRQVHIKHFKRADQPTMFTHLHTRSWFSFLAGGSSPRDLVHQAATLGMKSLALTDTNGLYGIVRFQKACRAAGIHPVIGTEALVEGSPLVLLARNQQGYQNLCLLLTQAHLKKADEAPAVSLQTLRVHATNLCCLTGGRTGLLWQQVAGRRSTAADHWLASLRELFPHSLYVELCHGLLPGDTAIIHRLYHLARSHELPVVATNDVRYAIPGHYRRYDLLNCIRLGLKLPDPHAQRPQNCEAYLKSEAQLRRLIPFPSAFDNTERLAESCHVDLVPEYITPPSANLPDGETARSYLRKLCAAGLRQRYTRTTRPQALKQTKREIAIISSLELEEFFLVVHEVVEKARELGIRCAGRGSAANSIIAYLLGITAVDPLEHNLLFERFLHGGRKGTPDIDVDFDSDRRDEIISWMEERFGIEQTAMTATVITYRLRMALREVAKSLGWPLTTIDKMTETVPSIGAGQVREFAPRIANVIGESPLLELLIDLVEGLDDCPRHMGLHAGGMVLSRKPLSCFSPIQISANGVKMVQFDKDDVEAMGLVKLDVLGLRMLACLSEALELAQRHERRPIDLDHLPLDDEGVFELIRSGKTLALFQIESMGQMHLIAKNQPETFDDLIAEIALFRPGPLQGGMVHPFIRRRRGEEPIVYDHPDLEPLLKDTYGIILFQEQVLEVAHRFAGMSLAAADDFRALMSKYHDPVKMEDMRERFVSGATNRGVDADAAHDVFDKVSKFIGYGFCRSHAAAFARTVYHSAWMKRYHPAAHMAAFMQHRPGMYSLMTLEEEARRFGVPVLPPCINQSGTRYDLELVEDGVFAIRKPLTSVSGVSEETARKIVWCRLSGPFQSVEDFVKRVVILRDNLDALARAGTFDSLCESSRRALWEAGVLCRRLENYQREETLFAMPLLSEEDIPSLPDLTASQRLSWDYKTHGAARVHPVVLARRALDDLGILSIQAACRFVPMGSRAHHGDEEKSSRRNPVWGETGPIVQMAGLVIMRQRPPTAKGFMFLTIEDETGFIQCVVHPKLQERLYDIIIQPSLILSGELQAVGNWRGLVLSDAWPMEGVFGGYVGLPSASGGQDRHSLTPEDRAA
jgi:error-prone DNA polymerase